jgi:predicted ATPase/class 3 adenylate cyclase/DNA-binding CsgD family transcriptional regulator
MRATIRTATLILGDMVGSTRAWEADPGATAGALARLEEIVDAVVHRHGGTRPVEQGEGDSFVALFTAAGPAIEAAVALHDELAREPWPEERPTTVRMAVHTGEIRDRPGGRIMGEAVNRCARIRELGHGGQVLVSGTTRDLVVDRLPAGLAFIDLGTHSLRDLDRPERVLQLINEAAPRTFPPLRSIDHHPQNLPAQLTSFVGREAELSATGELLETRRLLTLVGAGGCGKTRLAVRLAASHFEAFPDGVWFVDLAPIHEKDGVVLAFLQAAARVTGSRVGSASLEAALSGAHTLLVVDNCEHLVEEVAVVTERLLRECPKVTMLATSREPLGVEGEVVWRVPQLTLPSTDDDEALDAAESVQLFVERASQVRPGFAVTADNAAHVAAICRRLEGLPLAIELAAARVRVFPPAQIAAGLDDCFRVLGGGRRTAHGRQQTLEASLDWSYRLLSPTEQAILRRLGVCSGTFDQATAEATAAAGDIDSYAILDALTSMVDKSLVAAVERDDTVRFHLLEPIRQFALMALHNAGETAASRDRHLRHFLELSRQAFLPTQMGDAQILSAVEADYDNYRAALSWALDGNRRAARWLCSNLVFFWIWKRLWDEGLRWISQALGEEGWDQPETQTSLLGGAFIAVQLGQWDRTLRYVEAGVSLAESRRDDVALAWGLQVMEMVGDRTGHSRTLGALVERVLAMGEERTGKGPFLYALGRRGANQWWRGELAAAEATFGEAMQRSTTDGLDQYSGMYCEFLVRIRADRGDFDGADDACERGIDLRQRVGVSSPIFYHERGRVLAMRGLAGQANEQFATAIRLLAEDGVAVADSWAHHSVALLFRLAGAMPAAIQAVVAPPPQVVAAYEGVRWEGVSRAAVATGALVSGRLADAQVGFDLAAAAASAEGRFLYAPVADLGLAGCARERGDLATAQTHVVAALQGFVAMGARPSVVHALEEAAAIASLANDAASAARLFGCARAERHRLGYVMSPAVADHYAPFLTDASPADLARGAELSLAEAAAYVAGNRGRRRRPSTGWESLTPTELSVTGLVREGLSNAQIAGRLFMSARTVATHLTHIYTKLGITKRAELAARAVERGL